MALNSCRFGCRRSRLEAVCWREWALLACRGASVTGVESGGSVAGRSKDRVGEPLPQS